ncbi:putative acid--amine ligase YgiC [Austwickia sp. TVS 96-490-7B]|uniref:glutathionylspermidine synthase family protein n=1 Tax=Austwickia sp. TVS 96-490-7B TaxID=2830843 RepID=UPI001C59EBB5|nr:glutathionylspermidine synthase family protein [Austwickia sp. TVS 96-490-7B]MBW3086254.1 putative acid--amine ligase YgiC [Austwickia sp. TVS 96-490-7B]
MHRHPQDPRPDWLQRVRSQGLVYPETTHPDGTTTPYWYEKACYEIDADEVDLVEAATERLHDMCLEAARFLVTGAMGNLGLPPGALRRAGESLAADPPSLYGRFDLRYDGMSAPKLLEYNADTPTGLVESAVAQWYWLEDLYPDRDQWNSLHERLVLAWQAIAPRLAPGPIHFAHHSDEITGEEEMTVTYLRDTADQAGLATESITIEDIGWSATDRCFTDTSDRPLRTCFKLYPWEAMLAEEFGSHVEAVPHSPLATTWIEPLWKVVLSNKALLAALWHLYPDDELLLPAYLDSPGPLTEWVAKPLHGREGSGIRIHADGVELTSPGGGGSEGLCFQQWAPLPDMDGNKVVWGSWIVDGHAAGLGIRESDGWITDDRARFVPHVMSNSAPTSQVRQAWLADAGASVQDAVPGSQPPPLPGQGAPGVSTTPSPPPMFPLGEPTVEDRHIQDRPYDPQRRNR